MYSLREFTAMGWGKIRRAFLIAFRKKRVEVKLQRRRGACTRCGACCKIMFQCPAYDDSDGNPKCLIYNDRPGVCSLFPLDEKDLRERDVVMPGTKCGFYFDDGPNPNGNGNGNGKGESMPLRWGPSKQRPGDPKHHLGTGTIAILWSFIAKPKPNGNGRANGNGRVEH
jgi:hypothetical protein